MRVWQPVWRTSPKKEFQNGVSNMAPSMLQKFRRKTFSHFECVSNHQYLCVTINYLIILNLNFKVENLVSEDETSHGRVYLRWMHRLHCACVGRSPQHDGNRILTKVEESQTTRAKFGPAVWQDMDCTSENSPKMSALKINRNLKKNSVTSLTPV